jgi:hypothetical protein
MAKPNNSFGVEEQDSGFWSEVCACGHPVSRHTLVGTEYCRCESFPGECPCSGGVRVALLVQEDGGRVSASGSHARHFKRRFGVTMGHPLNGGISKTRGGGFEVQWTLEECDLCGEEWNVSEGDFTAYWTDSEGAPILGEMFVVTGRTLLVCGLCRVELEWKHGIS